MEAITKTTILTFTVVAAILLLGTFGGALPVGAMTSGTMIGSASAASQMWIPTLLLVMMLGAALVALFCEEE